MESLSFLPWVGDKYHHSRFGVKVLVLWASHYAEGPVSREFTQQVVRELGIEGRHRSFIKIIKILLNIGRGYISDDEKADAWRHVAFYNFVPDIVGTSRSAQPTAEMWERGKPQLLSVLEKLKPDVLLVLGCKTAEHLPELPSNMAVAKINDPSRVAYKDSHPAFQQALSEAGHK